MAEVAIRSGSKGRFEVELDGRRIFSKAEQNRFPKPGEIIASVRESLGPPVAWR
jgi:selT/selW/selH-like putative selenoprotein